MSPQLPSPTTRSPPEARRRRCGRRLPRRPRRYREESRLSGPLPKIPTRFSAIERRSGVPASGAGCDTALTSHQVNQELVDTSASAASCRDGSGCPNSRLRVPSWSPSARPASIANLKRNQVIWKSRLRTPRHTFCRKGNARLQKPNWRCVRESRKLKQAKLLVSLAPRTELLRGRPNPPTFRYVDLTDTEALALPFPLSEARKSLRWSKLQQLGGTQARLEKHKENYSASPSRVKADEGNAGAMCRMCRQRPVSIATSSVLQSTSSTASLRSTPRSAVMKPASICDSYISRCTSQAFAKRSR